MKNYNEYPGADSVWGTDENGPELLIMHKAFREIFDDENDSIPEEDELDEKKDYELTGKGLI